MLSCVGWISEDQNRFPTGGRTRHRLWVFASRKGSGIGIGVRSWNVVGKDPWISGGGLLNKLSRVAAYVRRTAEKANGALLISWS